MGRLWSGLRTLADGWRRLFKKNPDPEKERNNPEENMWVRENVLDPQIEVKVFSDKGEVTRAQVELIIRELQEFQVASGIPREDADESKVKSTLLLQMSVNMEDISNICTKLLRLCSSKVNDEVANYYINITISLVHCENQQTVPTCSYASMQAIEEPTNSDIEIASVETHELQHCSELHFDIPDPDDLQNSGNKKVNYIKSKSETECSMVKPISQTELDTEKGDVDEETRAEGHENEEIKNISETLVQKSAENTVCQALGSSKMTGKPSTSERKSNASPKPCLKPNPKPNPKPNNASGGRNRGMDADVVMSRLTRVLKNTEMCTEEFMTRDGTKQDIDNMQALEKSFYRTGITNRVRDEISGLKSNNTIWVEQKFAKMKKSVELLSYLHKLEFYALHERFPELVSFGDYVRSKEKQLKCPNVRRKYVALMLYGALIKEKCFEEKFQNYSKEIRKLRIIKQYIQFCLTNEDPTFHSNTCKIHNMQKCSQNRQKRSLKQSDGETKPEGKTDVGSDQTNCRQVEEETMDQSTDDSGDLKKKEVFDTIPGTEESSGDNLNQSEYVNSEVNGGLKSEGRMDTNDEGEGDRESKELRRKDLSQENWTFEKDAVESLDGRIRTKKYGKGAKRKFQEPKVKVKTRGVANRHIAPLKQEIVTEDAPELSTGDGIYNFFTNHEIFENSGDSIKETNKSKGSSDKIYLEKGLVSEPDFRHVECAPSTVIVGKKNECGDLGERYGASESYANSSNKSRRQRKKQQRANKVLTLGNLNNSALYESDIDDLMEDYTSTDESDESAEEFSEFLALNGNNSDDDANDCLCGVIHDFYDRSGTTLKTEPRIIKEKNILFSFY